MYFNLRLWEFTRGVRGRIAWAVLVGLAATGVGVARLALLGWLLARVFAGAPLGELLLPFAATGLVMLLRGVLEHWRNMIAHRTAAMVQLHIRKLLYDKVVELGPAHFGMERTGDVILSMVEGVEQLETYFGQYLPQLFVAVLTPLGIFAFVAFLDLPVAAVMLAFALLTLIGPQAFHKWDAGNARRRQQAYGAFGAEFLDAVQGLSTLKAFGQSEARGRLLADKAHSVFRTTMWVLSTNALARGITDTGIALGAGCTLILAAYRVVDGQMSLAALLVILMLGIEVYRPLRELRALLHNGMVGLSAAMGIFRILAARPHVVDIPVDAPSSGPKAPEAAGGADEAGALEPTVAFENVTFAYPGGRRAAHRGLSFQVGVGERVGIVGASGSGKSTIVKLLLRLYDPDQGWVQLGGRDLRKLSFARLRGMLAVVHQDTYLFHGTVEQNLRHGKPEATTEEMEAAAIAANAHDFIAQLPEGYATVVGERGIRLSGGQRQRIAIARALLRDAPILVLDEALSSVDAENEAVIQQALDRLMEGRTTLIFAHRLSSVIGADRLLVLEDGRLVESGGHAELMRKGGVYHRLMAAQAQESAGEPIFFVDDGDAPSWPVRHAALGNAAAESSGDASGDAAIQGSDGKGATGGERYAAQEEPTDAILRAEGLGWIGVVAVLLKMVMPWKVRLTATFALGVARVLALIGVGVLSALTVAAVKNGEPFGGLVLALVINAPVAGVLHWLESWMAHDMAFRLLAEMRIALFQKLERLAPAYLLRRRTGDLAAMATQDVEMVEYFFAHTVAPAFVAVLVPAAVMGTLLYYGWQMALALLPFLALVALSPFFMRRRIDALGSRTREALGELNAHAVDTIQGLSEVVAFQQEKPRGEAFSERIRAHHRIRMPFFRDLTFQMAMLEAATGFGGLAVVMAGVSLVNGGALDSAYLPMLTLLAMAAFLPIAEIANIGRQLADTLGATRRIYAVHGEEVSVRDGPGVTTARRDDAVTVRDDAVTVRDDAVTVRDGGLALRDDGTALELEDVHFAYAGGGRPALDGVSLQVPAGRTLALVGPSGAGKTTAANMLMRFWDPTKGVVRMNGHDLRDYGLEDLRWRIALVTQDTYLFNDTLGANILLARPEATPGEVERAVAHAALTEFVAALPEGLQTGVGERGVQLSGGQRQRVAIARAFLKDAPVLILDEATSHLDAVSEQAVRGAMEELMHDRTTVVIAHRLSTVRNAHRIVVLNEGRVAEQGTHQQLLAKGGLYSHLVSRQLAGAVGPAAD